MIPTPLPRMTEDEIKHFWSKVAIKGTNECWLWKEHVDKDGYPPFRLRGHRHKAARIALYIVTGVDPWPLLACHKCNNPTCCNPAHLYAGTQSQNLQQAISEGRAFIGDHNGRAKLTRADVAAIRASKRPYAELANLFNVSAATIESVHNRRSWKNIG
jgi:hypothetical protein